MMVLIPAAQRAQAHEWLARNRPHHTVLFGAVMFSDRADADAFKAAMAEGSQ